jgi:gamma-glutamyltranspeptidase/glutathione hydrolase
MTKKFIYLAVMSFSISSCQCPLLPSVEKSAVILAENESFDRSKSEARGPLYAISTQGDFSTKAAQKMFELGGNIVFKNIMRGK